MGVMESNTNHANNLSLNNGSKVAVMGAGPAGSMFSFFLLNLAEQIDLEIDLHLYEPKDFQTRGPKGCNMCGGIISESLVQTLAAEGVNLPSGVVQRGIEAYVLHTDEGTVRIDTPTGEKRIGAINRGRGPLKGPEGDWESFDGYLQSLAQSKGAVVRAETIIAVEWPDGRPRVKSNSGQTEEYDLLVVATGVNSKSLEMFNSPDTGYKAPRTTRTMIREYSLDQEQLTRYLGDSMHLFLLNLPRLEFAAVIPKGSCATLCLLGEKIDRSLLESFLATPQVTSCLPENSGRDQVCGCSPYMALGAAKKPYADRLVFIGDCGVSRLYKDGIGAAYRTAKAAAATACLKGISAGDFEKNYFTACRAITTDNRFGHIIFFVTTLIQKSRLAQRAVLRMVQKEQRQPNSSKRMSAVLWDTFTGSSPYKEIFFRTFHPGFLFGLVANLLWAVTNIFRSTNPDKAVSTTD